MFVIHRWFEQKTIDILSGSVLLEVSDSRMGRGGREGIGGPFVCRRRFRTPWRKTWGKDKRWTRLENNKGLPPSLTYKDPETRRSEPYFLLRDKTGSWDDSSVSGFYWRDNTRLNTEEVLHPQPWITSYTTITLYPRNSPLIRSTPPPRPEFDINPVHPHKFSINPVLLKRGALTLIHGNIFPYHLFRPGKTGRKKTVHSFIVRRPPES